MSFGSKSAVTTPASFAIQKSVGGNAIINASARNHAASGDHGAYQDIAAAIFGPLVTAHPIDPTQSKKKYLQNVDLDAPYQNRAVPIFSDFMTAQMINAQNSFYSKVMAPVYETPEQNFSMNRKEFNAITYTEMAEFGVPDEQTHFTYGWTDSTRKYALSTKISRDLAMDPNFGALVWMDEMAAFISNATFTVDLQIALTMVQTGYANLMGLRTMNSKADLAKLYAEESVNVFIMPADPEEGLYRVIRPLEKKIPGLDTIICPPQCARYFPSGPSETVLVEKIVPPNEYSAQPYIELVTGPDSYKTYKIGDRSLHLLESVPFRVNTQDQEFEIDPLKRLSTIGQFHPPNPNVHADDDVVTTNPNILDTVIFYQTKTMGDERRISMKDKLTNANYWDAKNGGRVSDTVKQYRDHLNRRIKSKDYSVIPYQWNPLYGNTHGDVNNDPLDYNKPIMSDVNGKQSLHDSPTWRHNFCGLLFDPQANEFTIPERIGCFHLSALQNEWIQKAAKHLVLEFSNRGGDFEQRYANFLSFRRAMRDAPVDTRYLRALIDKNMARLVRNGKINPARTPKEKADKDRFPGIELIDEWQPNRFGGMDLPDKDGRSVYTYPALFNSGVQYLVLANEGLNSASPWYEAGREAKQAVDFARFLLNMIKEYVGFTDCINAKLTPPWVHKDNDLIVLLDYLIGTEEPVFLGVPGKLNTEKNVDASKVGQPVTQIQGLMLTNDHAAAVREIDTLRANKNSECLIGNVDRALACVTGETHDKVVMMWTGLQKLKAKHPEFHAEMVSHLHTLCDYVINVCKYESSATLTSKQVVASSIVFDAFAESMNVLIASIADASKQALTDTEMSNILSAARNFAANFSNTTKTSRFYSELKKSTPVDEKADVTQTLFDKMKKLDRELKSRDVAVTEVDDFGAEKPDYDKQKRYEGDYSKKPTRYLRTPLASSRALRDYLQTNNFDDQWALPADANLFYEQAEEITVLRTGKTNRIKPHGKRGEMTSLSRALQVQSMIFSSKMHGGGGHHHDDDDDDDDDGGIMSRRKSTKSKFDVNRLLFGAPYGGDDDDDDDEDGGGVDDERTARSQRGRAARVLFSRSQYDDIEENYRASLNRVYVGPWRSRMNFQKNINLPGLALLFMIVCEAENNLNTVVRLASCGAQLFEVMIIRPFIEFESHAILAAKRGSDTMVAVINHCSVTTTKEARGIYHITCNFTMGIVRIKPENVALIPNAIPHRFIGGKKMDFMTNFDDWTLPNPAKGSNIGLLIPANERTFASPMHAMNNNTYIRPGIDDEVYERKCSAFESFYAWLTRGDNPASVDASHAERNTFTAHVPVSHVLHLGPTSYIDHLTGRKIDFEGVGPTGERRMNIEGAQHTWEGKTVRFPDKNAYYQNVNL